MQIIIDALGVANVGENLDYVVRVTWRLVEHSQVRGNDGLPVLVTETSKTLLPINPSAVGFIPFESLTEQVVQGWLATTSDYQDAVNNLAKKIATIDAPATQIKPLPWATN
jgi:hypothetical protein